MTGPRVIFVGLDAMDSGIVNRLVGAGRLPVLAELGNRGLRATTANPEGLLVGGCWPTIWSGTSPGEHGFYCFRQVASGRYEVRRFTPLDIDVPPFWLRLAEAGRSVALLDVPLVRPTTPSNGLHVVDFGTHDRMLEPMSTPSSLIEELRGRHGPHPVRGRCDDYAQEGRWVDLVAALEAATRWRSDVSADLLGRGDWDLFATVFSESHCIGHQLWWLHDPSWPAHDAKLADELGDAIARVYEAIDASVGRILAHADASTRVAVLMSHGIGAHHDGDHLLAQIADRLEAASGSAGVFVQARELAMRRGRRIVRAVQNRRHPGDPRYDRVTAVDGSRRFFPVPNNEMFGAVRLNLRGREPRGRVRPGAEAQDLTRWLSDEFLQLTDPDTGRRLVRRVLRVDDLYSGRHRDNLPDLLIDWERSAPINAAASPTIGVVRRTYRGSRSGDHRPNGQLLLSGPDVTPGRLSRRVETVEIAPTLCAWLGVELPDVDRPPMAEAGRGSYR